MNNSIIEPFTINDLTIAGATLLASLSACLMVCFRSRCRSCRLGCFSCEREIVNKVLEPEPEVESV